MAGGAHAAFVFCPRCAGKAARTHEGIEDDAYRCTACRHEFSIDWSEGAPLRACWSENADARAAAELQAEQYRRLFPPPAQEGS